MAVNPDRVIRLALWATVVVNAVGTLLFASLALGRPSALMPIDVPRYFAAQMGFVIALFGVVYAWLACQARINRPLLVVGGAGKLGFFGLTVVYALVGDVPLGMAMNATPDFVFACVFFWWALSHSPGSVAHVPPGTADEVIR